MSRSQILSKIRATTDKLKEKAAYPDYDTSVMHSAVKLTEPDLWKAFSANFKAVNGRAMDSVVQLIEFLDGNNQRTGYCDPDLFDSIGSQLVAAGLTVETIYDRDRYDDYQFGITRATGAIAESGSLIIDDFKTSHRLAALSPWVHVGVLKKDEILRTIPDAITAFGDAPNIIWCTGPSKTADVEGILIEGVHGPGEQIALLV
ncbi:MAG: LUD domain-containing protein [Akkermansiaceae bacterium]|nr:LUD domain-containing protein [Akkermansiaceae bacterium]